MDILPLRACSGVQIRAAWYLDPTYLLTQFVLYRLWLGGKGGCLNPNKRRGVLHQQANTAFILARHSNILMAIAAYQLSFDDGVSESRR
jgi:hypothetical protein